MARCKNCSRKLTGAALFCCHCGYPMAVARAVPRPLRLWPVAPEKFWKLTMALSLLLAVVAKIGFIVHAHLGLPCLYCVYPFVLGVVVFLWALLGSRKGLR